MEEVEMARTSGAHTPDKNKNKKMFRIYVTRVAESEVMAESVADAEEKWLDGAYADIKPVDEETRHMYAKEA